MSPNLIDGDHVSCSRIGGAMRREASRLHQHIRLLDEALGELATWSSSTLDPAAQSGASAAAARVSACLEVLKATAQDLDAAGAVLQQYATDLAESHELGRRAGLRVKDAGLVLDGTRVVEPWGPANAQDAVRRRAEVPQVQARVDLAAARVGRARGRLDRAVRLLTEDFSAHSRDARSARDSRSARDRRSAR